MNFLQRLNESSHAIFIAKAFLVGYGSQLILTFGPMLSDPASILSSLIKADFDFDFVNNALGKALVAAWGIALSSPYNNILSTPQTITTLPIKIDLKDK